MGRRKPAEGLIVNLDLSFTGKFIIEDHIGTPLSPPPPPPKKEKVKKEKKKVMNEPIQKKKKDSVVDILNSSVECMECHRRTYSPVLWKNKEVCDDCHRPLVQDSFEQLYDYIRTECNNQCAFCHSKYERRCRFHFDHINMFSKELGVVEMVVRGEDMEKVIAEAKK